MAAENKTYKIKSGDTLWALAKKFNISLNQLAKANPNIKDLNRIYVNQVINIPASNTSQKEEGADKNQSVTSEDNKQTSSKNPTKSQASSNNRKAYEDWALKYFDWATSQSGGMRNASQKDLELALKYLPEDKAARLRYIYDIDVDSDTKAKDAQTVSNHNHEAKVKQAWALAQDYATKRGWDSGSMEEYKKMYDLTDEELYAIMAATQKNLREYNQNRDNAIAYKDATEVSQEELIDAMHNGQNKVVQAGISLLNGPSHMTWGAVRAATDPNYSFRDYLEGIIDPAKNTSASDVVAPSQVKGPGTAAIDIVLDPLSLTNLAASGYNVMKNGIQIGRELPAAMLEQAGVRTNFRRFGNNMFNPVSGVPRYGRRGAPVKGIITPEDDVTRLARNHYLENIAPTTQRPGQRLYSPVQFMPGNQNYRYLHGTSQKVPYIFEGADPFVNPIPGLKYISFDNTSNQSGNGTPKFVYTQPVNYRQEVTVGTYGSEEFQKAFKKAREEGKTEFEFKGKTYTTDLGNPVQNVEALPTVERPVYEDIVVVPTSAYQLQNPTQARPGAEYAPYDTKPIEGSSYYVPGQKKGGKLNYLKHYK